MSPRDQRPQAGIDDAVRCQLIVLAQNSRTRSSEFTKRRPTEWRPNEVRNPEGVLDRYFTEETAWELIATRLERGEKVTVIPMNQPKGAKGYVMSIDMGPDVPYLYVKLQLGSGTIFGRSFHYSETEKERERISNGTKQCTRTR